MLNYVRLLRSSETLMLAGRATQLFSQMAMLLVVPKVLVPELYVQLNLVLPLAFLGVSLVFGWMNNAIHRHVYELLGDEGGRFRQTVFKYYALVCLLLCSITFFSQLYATSIYLLVPLLLAAAALKLGILGVLNASGNGKGFFFSSVGFAFSLLLFVSLCFIDTQNNLYRNLIVYALVDIIVAIIAWWGIGVFRAPPMPVFYKSIAVGYFKYGLPLVAKMIGVWVISISDRYLLTIWEAPKEVASYILSYQLAGSAITIPMSFVMAVIFPKILKIEKEAGQNEALTFTYKILRFYLRLMIPVFVIVSIIILLLQYYIYTNYQFTPLIVVTIVLAHVIFELSHFYNKEYELNGRTLMITKAVGVGAIVNVLLNLLFIPILGGVGAAIATLLAYLCVIYIVYSNRQYRMSTKT